MPFVPIYDSSSEDVTLDINLYAKQLASTGTVTTRVAPTIPAAKYTFSDIASDANLAIYAGLWTALVPATSSTAGLLTFS